MCMKVNMKSRTAIIAFLMQIPDYMVHLKKNAFVIFHHNVITCLQPSFLVKITKAPVIKRRFTICQIGLCSALHVLLVLIP